MTLHTRIKLSVLLLTFSVSSQALASKSQRITILHTNDHHGRYWKNDKGEYGMSARKTLIDKLRLEADKNGSCLFLLSGGDINTGEPTSDLLDAEPDFKGMNLLGYDAMAVGNHEFDNPMSVLRKQQKWSKFPFLGANVYSSKTNKRLFKPYIVIDGSKRKNCGDLKIGILGLTSNSVTPTYADEDSIEVRSPIHETLSILPELKKKTDLIFAVTHMGHEPESRTEQDDTKLAKKTKGINVIIGGHSQKPLFEPERIKDTLIVQAHEWGKYVGKLELTYDGKALKLDEYKLIPVNLKKKVVAEDGTRTYVLLEKEIEENTQMLNLLTPFYEKAQQELLVEIGEASALFDGSRTFVRNNQAPIGQVFNRAYMEKVNAKIGIMNGGGIRNSIPAGKISYSTVLKIAPFGDTIVKVELTGTNLLELFPKLKNTTNTTHVTGLKGIFNGDELISLKVNGTDVDANEVYTIATRKYFAKELGLDSYPSFTDTGYVDADAIKNFISKREVMDPADFKAEEVFIQQD